MTPISWFKSLFSSADSTHVTDYGGVSIERLHAARKSADNVCALLQSLDERGETLLDCVLNGKDHVPWQHYPWQGGVLDQRNQCQFFYHSHEDYSGEHGHFHTFIYHKRKLVHLVAIGLDDQGQVNRLYTFNRWGPGDHYLPAEKLKALLPRFFIQAPTGCRPEVTEFVSQVLAAFRTEIECLFDQRDRTFDRYRKENNGASPYEDRALEITSRIRVDLGSSLVRLSELTAEEPATELPPVAEKADVIRAKTNVDQLQQRPVLLLRKTLQAGENLLALQDDMKQSDKTVLRLLMGEEMPEPWQMYPWDGGVIDKRHRSQYFYHKHPQTPEHGHFHTFYHFKDELVHLVGIVLNNDAEPIELITVNRWVTGDLNLPAKKIKKMLNEFRVEGSSFDRRVHQFVRGVIQLYLPEIEVLLDQREATYQRYRDANKGAEPYEDRSLEVTSSLPIDVRQHVDTIRQVLQKREVA